MGEAIPKEVKDLWEKWNIRGLVILSLALQTILVLLSPNRKRTHLRSFRFLMWSAYLLANWAAEYAVGQISENQGEQPQPKNNDLLAFWSTFLLLHLGGPDTITALALEDNDLWLRNLFGLICQAIATVYIFLLSIPNNLLVPTALMLMAGVIKYVERIKALRGASLKTFKNSMLGEPDPGPDYARLMDEYSTRKTHREPTRVLRIEEVEKGQKPKAFVKPDHRELTHLEIVQYGYKYFNVFKGLVVDLIFSSQTEKWNSSKEFFKKSEPEEALKVLEVELSFMYGTFYTKVDILHTRIGFAFRFLALASLVSSLCIFATAKKHDYDRFDVGLTYALLIGGIALDFVAIFIFCVSDWTAVQLRKPKEDVNEKSNWLDTVLNYLDEFFNWLLGFRELKWKCCSCPKNDGSCMVLDRKFIFRRWSEYIYKYNLIGYSLGIKPQRVHRAKGYIHSCFDDVISYLCIKHAISCIFLVISSCFRTMKQKLNDGRKKLNHFISSSSTKKNRWMYYLLKLFLKFWFGIPMINYVLDFFGISDQLNALIYTSHDRITQGMWNFMFKEVKLRYEAVVERQDSASKIYSARGEWALDKAFEGKYRNVSNGMRLLLSVTQADYDQSILMWHIATELLYQTREGSVKNREFSKILSDYMMYLLVVQPDLMSTVAGIDKLRFMEAIAEAKKFPEVKNFVARNHLEDSKDEKKVCEEILNFYREPKERVVKRNQRRNVLEDASRLANALLSEKGEDVMWEVVSKVWMEMLCYAATHCDPKQHVAQLSRGGEIISFVWLLMAHFGLGEQFQTTDEIAIARVIVAK